MSDIAGEERGWEGYFGFVVLGVDVVNLSAHGLRYWWSKWLCCCLWMVDCGLWVIDGTCGKLAVLNVAHSLTIANGQLLARLCVILRAKSGVGKAILVSSFSGVDVVNLSAHGLRCWWSKWLSCW